MKIDYNAEPKKIEFDDGTTDLKEVYSTHFLEAIASGCYKKKSGNSEVVPVLKRLGLKAYKACGTTRRHWVIKEEADNVFEKFSSLEDLARAVRPRTHNQEANDAENKHDTESEYLRILSELAAIRRNSDGHVDKINSIEEKLNYIAERVDNLIFGLGGLS